MLTQNDKKNIIAFLNRCDLKGNEAEEHTRLKHLVLNLSEMEIIPVEDGPKIKKKPVKKKKAKKKRGRK